MKKLRLSGYITSYCYEATKADLNSDFLTLSSVFFLLPMFPEAVTLKFGAHILKHISSP